MVVGESYRPMRSEFVLPSLWRIRRAGAGWGCPPAGGY